MLTEQDIYLVVSDAARRGASADKLSYILNHLKNGGGELSPKLSQKIAALINGIEIKGNDFKEKVNEWVQSQTGHFLVTDGHRDLGLVTPVTKHHFNVMMTRMRDKGIIEKHGDKSGCYRKVENTFTEQEWWRSSGVALNIQFPLGVERYAKVYHGNVILLEGQKSQGKSAFAIEFCRLNTKIFPGQRTLYQNVEMSDDEIKKRIETYVVDDMWSVDKVMKSVEFVRRTETWWDIIKPDGLNVVDYLIEYEKSYLIAQYIWNIHKKLKNGVALVLVQRDPKKEYGAGGYHTRNIPRLVLSLQHHTIKLEDVKSFTETCTENPTGMQRRYKQASWWKFLGTEPWHKDEEEKYGDYGKKEEKLIVKKKSTESGFTREAEE